MVLDPTGTIGSMPCEKSLNKILAEANNEKLTHKIIGIIQTAKLRIKQLNSIEDDSFHFYLSELILKDISERLERTIDKIEESKETSFMVKSHTNSCLHAYFSNARRKE